MEAEEFLRQGRLAEALERLQEQVRKDPAQAKHRVFLFQLLSVLGQWQRALTQLNVAAEMDAANLLMANVCRPALSCEALRAEIFAGKRRPLLFGEPAEWAGWLVQANQLGAEGKHAAAAELRDKAFEACEAVSGSIDGAAFEWIADADPRLGPVLEAIIQGKYYWVPFTNIRRIVIEPPADLRDVVWTCAQFVWTNGGETFGLIPTRYAGSETCPDDAVKLARRTEWIDQGPQWCVGLGQRLLATDQGEYPLLEARSIELNAGQPPGAAQDG